MFVWNSRTGNSSGKLSVRLLLYRNLTPAEAKYASADAGEPRADKVKLCGWLILDVYHDLREALKTSRGEKITHLKSVFKALTLRSSTKFRDLLLAEEFYELRMKSVCVCVCWRNDVSRFQAETVTDVARNMHSCKKLTWNKINNPSTSFTEEISNMYFHTCKKKCYSWYQPEVLFSFNTTSESILLLS